MSSPAPALILKILPNGCILICISLMNHYFPLLHWCPSHCSELPLPSSLPLPQPLWPQSRTLKSSSAFTPWGPRTSCPLFPEHSSSRCPHGSVHSCRSLINVTSVERLPWPSALPYRTPAPHLGTLFSPSHLVSIAYTTAYHIQLYFIVSSPVRI